MLFLIVRFSFIFFVISTSTSSPAVSRILKRREDDVCGVRSNRTIDCLPKSFRCIRNSDCLFGDMVCCLDNSPHASLPDVDRCCVSAETETEPVDTTTQRTTGEEEENRTEGEGEETGENGNENGNSEVTAPNNELFG
ncbi:hypothetical protein CHUAL_005990 [Chamberlinius hualienensis]